MAVSTLSGDAGERLSGTFELLEQILSDQSATDLARWQRVCRQWRDLMANSKLLQRKMFLSPVTERKSLGWRYESSPRRPFRRRPPLGRRVPFLVEGSEHGDPAHTNLIVDVHPALQVLPGASNSIRRNLIVTTSTGSFFDARRFLHHAPGAWREMFLTQPPTTTVTITPDCPSEYGRSERGRWSTITDANGVTFGLLIDEIKRGLKRYEESPMYAVFHGTRAWRNKTFTAMLQSGTTESKIIGAILDDSRYVRKAEQANVSKQEA